MYDKMLFHRLRMSLGGRVREKGDCWWKEYFYKPASKTYFIISLLKITENVFMLGFLK